MVYFWLRGSLSFLYNGWRLTLSIRLSSRELNLGMFWSFLDCWAKAPNKSKSRSSALKVINRVTICRYTPRINHTYALTPKIHWNPLQFSHDFPGRLHSSTTILRQMLLGRPTGTFAFRSHGLGMTGLFFVWHSIRPPNSDDPRKLGAFEWVLTTQMTNSAAGGRWMHLRIEYVNELPTKLLPMTRELAWNRLSTLPPCGSHHHDWFRDSAKLSVFVLA